MIKKSIRKILRKFGYDISKIQPEGNLLSDNPYFEMGKLLKNKLKPVIFDVGANVGQSVYNFLDYFPKSEIYSFEPGPDTFLKISEKYNNVKNVHLENIALGSKVTQQEFIENDHSDMSSFLEIGEAGWGKVKNKTLVNISTVDSYCQKNNINKIDILKSDTQGFELEVFKGSLQMMTENNIHLLYFEFTFSDVYKGLPSFDEVYKLLRENNFQLVSIFNFNYSSGVLSFVDMLFVNSSYQNI